MTTRKVETLREIQTWMVGAITGAEVEAIAPERVVTPSARMTAKDRLDVYRLAYKARLVECLADDFKVVSQMMGEAAFETLAHAYIDRFPSTSPNLNAYGRRMSAFIRESNLASPFASELAALEWAIVEVIHAASSPPLDLTELASLPPEAWATARLVKCEAVQLFRFEHPVNAFFQSAMNDAMPAEEPAPSPSFVVVYRTDATVWRMDLSAAMTRVLGPILDGATIGEALGALEAHGDPSEIEDASRSLSTWFGEWARSGLFTRVERPSSV